MIIRSLLYGWLGAIIAGLFVGVSATVFGIPEERMVTLATATGIVLGSLGLSLPWARRLAISRTDRPLSPRRRGRR